MTRRTCPSVVTTSTRPVSVTPWRTRSTTPSATLPSGDHATAATTPSPPQTRRPTTSTMSLSFLISDHGPYALSGERVKDKESELGPPVPSSRATTARWRGARGAGCHDGAAPAADCVRLRVGVGLPPKQTSDDDAEELARRAAAVVGGSSAGRP